ncbi:sugar diacid recognition domain-containing protein [Pseudogulbenkiania sp. MAI-1]|uniref:sugar diacid recognition domain-containing protein n=1 Tax=Pseudogulbenkiania sp. MAI-1 TaxID=990370 RepID=UPI00045EB20A|nr:sugar diacid recognition domain-containing protein [Pseudogulbenkiania sp. MAI-1]
MIGSELAQQIVERAMKIIPFSVNVMDARGIIIASGNVDRIGDLHPGAQLALARAGTVEIDDAAIPNLPGAKAGINLPLSVRGEICGVVGITGQPEQVRQFGELVRLTAEMILEQAQLIGELQREKKYREEFVFQLITQSGMSSASMEAWAARLGIDVRQTRAVIVLELAEEMQRPDVALSRLQRVQTELATHWPALLMAVINPRELALLEPFDASGGHRERSTRARKRLQALADVLDEELGKSSVLAMGVALPGLDGAAASYQAAKNTARVGRLRDPQRQLFSYYELSLPVLLSGLDVGWQAEQLQQLLVRLKASDGKSGTLLKTLTAWFANNTHPSSTAKAMHIHRNTLDYRLQKIGELTGLDLDNTDDRLLLYVALQLKNPSSS